MTQAHKDALSRGRTENKAVNDYLSALQSSRRPGRPVTESSVKERIAAVQGQIDAADNPAKRIELIQKRLDLEQRLATLGDSQDLSSLEAAFVTVAAGYSERKGITWTAWREGGVSADVLKRAGVPRTRRTL